MPFQQVQGASGAGVLGCRRRAATGEPGRRRARQGRALPEAACSSLPLPLPLPVPPFAFLAAGR